MYSDVWMDRAEAEMDREYQDWLDSLAQQDPCCEQAYMGEPCNCGTVEAHRAA